MPEWEKGWKRPSVKVLGVIILYNIYSKLTSKKDEEKESKNSINANDSHHSNETIDHHAHHSEALQQAHELPTLATRDKPLFGDDYTVVFVLGGPGAGKGTQSEKIVNEFGFTHLSAGDLLRAERQREGSKYGELINTYIKEGQIVPMQITINLLEDAMKRSGSKRFLIDGFPREIEQANAFEKQVCKSAFVLYFDCPEEEMAARLLKRGITSGRVDDNAESIRKRFETFRKQSIPVVTKYEQDNKVRKVSCLSDPSTVFEDTKKHFIQYYTGN
ncbi:UMP-CMP kinase domain-containing protein [Rozella allomycis CSF55]|uniref:Uridylate kinase n=1 Tax=Rozella allomycis (strain CSF55) TaxID=988480 RepID=A0A075AX69_ROZAC|nr:UMP-CMP kinase domain-containing protein [Rozella allomycis CSF55]|eukprot:EPZ34857.1 UMP-CMP kinase domain-containing protein [Rozella allomycis CSF55]